MGLRQIQPLRPLSGAGINADAHHAGRGTREGRGKIAVSQPHDPGKNGGRSIHAPHLLHGGGVKIAHPDTNRDFTGEAHAPVVAEIGGSARLARIPEGKVHQLPVMERRHPGFPVRQNVRRHEAGFRRQYGPFRNGSALLQLQGEEGASARQARISPGQIPQGHLRIADGETQAVMRGVSLDAPDTQVFQQFQ